MKKTALQIALRYFGFGVWFKLPSHSTTASFIRLLTHLAMWGVAVSTAALIVVLSVFNGLEQLTIGLFQIHNAQIKVSPVSGKSFFLSDDSLQALSQLDGVQAVTPVCQDNSLAHYDDSEPIIVTVKGVAANFLQQYPIDTALSSGTLDIHSGAPKALIGIGVQYKLGINLQNEFDLLQLWYPRNNGYALHDPSQAFRKQGLRVSGVLVLEQNFDEKTVIVPLNFMQQLMDYAPNQYTALEIKAYGDEQATKRRVAKFMGSGFEVLDRIEQQTTVLQAIRVERLFVFVAFIFIISIAAFNIFFSLAMLSIEKKRDIAILFAIGADRKLLQRVYLYLGLLIGGAGVVLGLVTGFVLCVLQDRLGLIGLGSTEAIVHAYPVQMQTWDFVIVAALVFVITLLATIVPARNAAKYETGFIK